VTETPIKLDPSQLLEVAAALKHGQVIPWATARKAWADKPISNVGLFGLLVSTWPAFLDVSAAVSFALITVIDMAWIELVWLLPGPSHCIALQEFVNDPDVSIKSRLLEVCVVQYARFFTSHWDPCQRFCALSLSTLCRTSAS
jgi:hypothetical protein